MIDNLSIAKEYLQAVENGATGESLARFYCADVLQEELPNRLVPEGVRRDLNGILEAAVRGQKVIQRQTFTIKREYVAGESVVLEMVWVGILSVPFDSIPVGGEMRAHIVSCLDFREGQIVSQRSYDCFESW